LVANFGSEESSLVTVANMYSSGELLVDTAGSSGMLNHQVAIKDLSLAGGHAFVLKLPM